MHAVLITLLSALTLSSGCSKNSPAQAIDQAVMQLEVYSKSRSVVFSGTPDPDVPNAKAKQQEIRRISSEQQQQFKAAMENLKNLANEPVEDNIQAKDAARVKTLLAAMQLYVSNGVVNELTLFDSQFVGLQEKINNTCIQIEQIKQEQEKIQPANYDQPINQSKLVITEVEKARELTDSQIKKLSAVIEKLQVRLKGLQEQRDTLNTKIGDISDKINTVSGEEAVRLQKIVGELEQARFKILVEIEKLTAGPMELPPELQVEVGTQKLQQIGGLKQLDQQKQQLLSQLKSIEQASASQKAFLNNLQQQVQIVSQKGAKLAQQLDAQTAVLKSQLKAMEELVNKRNALQRKADSEAQAAGRYAQQAGTDLKRYLGAVSQAKSSAAAGAEDNILKNAEGLDSLEFTIGNVTVSSQLNRAKIMSMTMRLMETLSPVIKRSQALTALPSELAKTAESAQATYTKMAKELSNALNQALGQYESVNKKASRGNFQTVVGTSLATAYNQASLLLPEKKQEFTAKANALLEKIVAAPTAGSSADDPLTLPAKELKKELSM